MIILLTHETSKTSIRHTCSVRIECLYGGKNYVYAHEDFQYDDRNGGRIKQIMSAKFTG